MEKVDGWCLNPTTISVLVNLSQAQEFFVQHN